MKACLLSFILISSFLLSKAQKQVNTLPAGKYETVNKINQNKWERGDIILLDDNKYKISTTDEVGDYKFSITAQRVFFTSGPLKTVYAKTSLIDNRPAIVLPAAENAQAGVKLPGDITGFLKIRN